ncbi:hypothetical protein Tco_0467935 [Tanacetum coccineum]
MYGVSPADLWDGDAKRFDEFMRSMKEEKAWRESNTCTSCGRLNWNCWCKMNYEEMSSARKGPSTPVKTQQKNRLTSGDKSLDLSAFKLSRLFFSLLSSRSSSCWRPYGAQWTRDEHLEGNSLSDYSLSDLELLKDIYI